jgi:hypothetical protein
LADPFREDCNNCPTKKIPDDISIWRLAIGIVGCGVGGFTAALLPARQIY